MELEDVHLATLALTALVILYADHLGFQYWRGTRALLPKRVVEISHWCVSTGLTLMILSGLGMVMPAWSYYSSEPVFFMKLAFVGVLVVNAFAIAKLSKVAFVRPFAELSREEQQTLMLSGVLSGVGWVGAAAIGFLFL